MSKSLRCIFISHDYELFYTHPSKTDKFDLFCIRCGKKYTKRWENDVPLPYYKLMEIKNVRKN